MRTSLTFGQVAGIPLKVHFNWFFVAALVTWSLAAGYFPQEYPQWETLTYWTLAVTTAIFFFASVLMHEIGHAVIALLEGVPVRSITLFILGGVAHIEHEPETAGAEFRIVVAGPLTSLLLAGFFFAIYQVAIFGSELSAAALYLSQMNVILAVFNLVPGFPLDGGRILRALLWKLTDNFYRATRIGRSAGFFIAFLFILGGVALAVQGNYFGGLWTAFIGWYLANAAQESFRQAILTEPRTPTARSARMEEATKPLPRFSGEV